MRFKLGRARSEEGLYAFPKLHEGKASNKERFVPVRFSAHNCYLGALKSKYAAQRLNDGLIRTPVLGRRGDRDFERASYFTDDCIAPCSRLGAHGNEESFGMLRDCDHKSVPPGSKSLEQRGAHADQRCSFLDGNFEIVGHAH